MMQYTIGHQYQEVDAAYYHKIYRANGIYKEKINISLTCNRMFFLISGFRAGRKTSVSQISKHAAAKVQ